MLLLPFLFVLLLILIMLLLQPPFSDYEQDQEQELSPISPLAKPNRVDKS